jgi:hypothetical protein
VTLPADWVNVPSKVFPESVGTTPRFSGEIWSIEPFPEINASSLGADVPPPEQLVSNNKVIANAKYLMANFFMARDAQQVLDR